MREKRKRSFDRRSGDDRRKVYTLGFFLNGGKEKRSGKERRRKKERRKSWIRKLKSQIITGIEK